ncbi:MAG: hypothetical protein FWG67_08035 [Defluviitaleaceae bacterium]|nr:hypothetical protein [Defluviitaleaceae bacterium]
MLKRMGCLLLLAWGATLVGCEGEQHATAYRFDVHLIENVETVAERAHLYDVFYDQEAHTLQRINLVTGEKEAVFEFDERQLYQGMRVLYHGYYAVFVFVGDQVYELKDGFDGSDLEDVTVMLLVLDQALERVDEFVMTNLDLVLFLWNAEVFYTDGHWYVVNFDMMSSNMYAYHLQTHETTLIFEVDAPLFMRHFQMTPLNQIAFVKGNMENPSQNDYGFFDLNTLETVKFSTTDFVVAMLDVAGHYLVVHENQIHEEGLEIEVVLLNLLTAESRRIPLIDFEAAAPQLLADGELLLTAVTDWETNVTTFRMYDSRTLDVVFEYEQVVDEEETLWKHQLFELGYGVYVMTLMTQGDDDRLNFYHTVIEIEGPVDESH